MEESTRFRSLPVGYRFCPSDKELLGFFLYMKITGMALPPEYDRHIKDCDLYAEYEPWQIWEYYREENGNEEDKEKEEMFFFTKLKEKSANGSRISRTVGCSGGVWQSKDSAKKVPPKRSGRKLGSKKRFRYENKGSMHDRGWIMHEYSLDSSLLESPDQSNNYVLCRIKKNVKVMNKRKQQEEEPANICGGSR
ncbi:hypothetical protein ACOSQ2_018226 [Xanthoceras sorbifolium]